MQHQERSFAAGTRRVAVLGAGPAGLMAAETLALKGIPVTVFDGMPSAGRKFLMAGRGGLNLTHSEPLPTFLQRYGQAQEALTPAIQAFPPEALLRWCEELGEPVFVGSSGRVFPRAFKASPLLRAWLRRLADTQVDLRLRHRWCGFSEDGDLLFQTPEGPKVVAPSATILALGGGSWPRLGSDGQWTSHLQDIRVAPLRPSNMGFKVSWSSIFRDRFAGTPLKRIALQHRDRSWRGEAVITQDGLEGGVIYAAAALMRGEIEQMGFTEVQLDLRPDIPAAEVTKRVGAPRRGQSLSNHLRRTLSLPPVSIGLIQEALHGCGGERTLPDLVKACPLKLRGFQDLEHAISTAGGISFQEIDDGFMLRRRPGVFAAGEMLDWEAPTGGYLLQACFATGRAAAVGAAKWLNEHPAPKPI
ncbi:TIGR03862 family flavoprotein [Pseudoroseomonas globiformis]|uniref:TIGR03862 family flavoprotein n=1 Tax=Teichococcus globiformis TaxID=2307229 RepID=A0ABV7FZU3_9PROT